jgi:predicted ester cyclase
VLAHQITSENPISVKRTPVNYANHVREFLRLFGNYQFEITELLASKDKVYVRWKQTGKHMAEIDGYPATRLPLIEYTSAVYRIKDNKIVEYWIQMDRLGFDLQLKQNIASIQSK